MAHYQFGLRPTYAPLSKTTFVPVVVNFNPQVATPIHFPTKRLDCSNLGLNDKVYNVDDDNLFDIDDDYFDDSYAPGVDTGSLGMKDKVVSDDESDLFDVDDEYVDDNYAPGVDTSSLGAKDNVISDVDNDLFDVDDEYVDDNYAPGVDTGSLGMKDKVVSDDESDLFDIDDDEYVDDSYAPGVDTGSLGMNNNIFENVIPLDDDNAQMPAPAVVDANVTPAVDTPAPAVVVEEKETPAVDTPTPAVDTPTPAVVAEEKETPAVDTPAPAVVDANVTPAVDTPAPAVVEETVTPTVDTPTPAVVAEETVTPAVDTPAPEVSFTGTTQTTPTAIAAQQTEEVEEDDDFEPLPTPAAEMSPEERQAWINQQRSNNILSDLDDVDEYFALHSNDDEDENVAPVSTTSAPESNDELFDIDEFEDNPFDIGDDYTGYEDSESSASIKETNQFNGIRRIQKEGLTPNNYKSVDLNGDGIIDTQEMIILCKLLDIPFNPINCSVKVEDFGKVVSRINKLQRIYKEGINKNNYQLIDLNGDGMIDEEEMKVLRQFIFVDNYELKGRNNKAESNENESSWVYNITKDNIKLPISLKDFGKIVDTWENPNNKQTGVIVTDTDLGPITETINQPSADISATNQQILDRNLQSQMLAQWLESQNMDKISPYPDMPSTDATDQELTDWINQCKQCDIQRRNMLVNVLQDRSSNIENADKTTVIACDVDGNGILDTTELLIFHKVLYGAFAKEAYESYRKGEITEAQYQEIMNGAYNPESVIKPGDFLTVEAAIKLLEDAQKTSKVDLPAAINQCRQDKKKADKNASGNTQGQNATKPKRYKPNFGRLSDIKENGLTIHNYKALDMNGDKKVDTTELLFMQTTSTDFFATDKTVSDMSISLEDLEKLIKDNGGKLEASQLTHHLYQSFDAKNMSSPEQRQEIAQRNAALLNQYEKGIKVKDLNMFDLNHNKKLEAGELLLISDPRRLKGKESISLEEIQKAHSPEDTITIEEILKFAS